MNKMCKNVKIKLNDCWCQNNFTISFWSFHFRIPKN